MKNLLKLMILVSFTAGCSSNEASLIDYAPIQFTVPDFNQFSESSMFDLVMTNENTIEGFTEGFHFATDNNFETYTFVEESYHDFSHDLLYYKSFDHQVLIQYDNAKNMALDRILTSSGFVYEPKIQHRDITSFTSNNIVIDGVDGDHFFAFIDEQNGIAAAPFSGNWRGIAKRVNGIVVKRITNNSDEVISFLDSEVFGYLGDVIDIYLGQEYYLLTRPFGRQMRLLKSNDDGVTWQDVSTFSREIQKVVVVSSSKILLKSSNSFLYSGDGGGTWSERIFGNHISEPVGGCHVDGQGNVYVTGGEKIYRSSDAGENWAEINQTFVYTGRPYFYDNLNGIIYTDNILQRTTDGGITWKLLLFPYD